MPGVIQDILFVAVVAVLFVAVFKYAQPLERWFHERRRRRNSRA